MLNYLSRKTLFTTLLLGLVLGTCFTVRAFDIDIQDELFVGQLSSAKNYPAAIGFVYGGNQVNGSLFLRSSLSLSTPETVILSGVSISCTKQLQGLYYNASRGTRMWPLDQSSLIELSGTSTSYAGLTVTGGLFTECVGTGISSTGVYGQITHTRKGSSYYLIAGTTYNFTTNSLVATFGHTLTLEETFGHKVLSGHLYDSYSKIGQVQFIDKIAPWFNGVATGSSYSSVTITFADPNLSGATLSGINGTSYYSGNFANGSSIATSGTYIFTVKDTLGNTTGAIFVINPTIPRTTTTTTTPYGFGGGGAGNSLKYDGLRFKKLKIIIIFKNATKAYDKDSRGLLVFLSKLYSLVDKKIISTEDKTMKTLLVYFQEVIKNWKKWNVHTTPNSKEYIIKLDEKKQKYYSPNMKTVKYFNDKESLLDYLDSNNQKK